MRITSRTIVLSLAVASLGLSPAAALAKHGADDGVARNGDDNGGLRDDNGGSRAGKRVTGTCTDGSTVKLKAKPDNGRLEIEIEVDQNRSGVRWKVRAHRDGKLVIRTSAVTRAPSGSFSVDRKIRNPAGSDRIAARATSPSGEVCRASLTI